MGMNSEALFSMALGLQPPWQVVKIAFVPNASGREELHLTLGFPPGSRFPGADGTPCRSSRSPPASSMSPCSARR